MSEERLINKLKERNSYPDIANDKGIINKETGSSMIMNDVGHFTIASSKDVQYKLNHASGQSKEISLESKTITNRKTLKTDEVVLNNHKLNPHIYELTDMKRLYDDPNFAIGNLTMNATVLVKAWEPNLKKWVLIRRPMRTPLFYNDLGEAKIPLDLDIDNNIVEEIELTNPDKKENKEEGEQK